MKYIVTVARHSRPARSLRQPYSGVQGTALWQFIYGGRTSRMRWCVVYSGEPERMAVYPLPWLPWQALTDGY